MIWTWTFWLVGEANIVLELKDRGVSRVCARMAHFETLRYFRQLLVGGREVTHLGRPSGPGRRYFRNTRRPHQRSLSIQGPRKQGVTTNKWCLRCLCTIHDRIDPRTHAVVIGNNCRTTPSWVRSSPEPRMKMLLVIVVLCRRALVNLA